MPLSPDEINALMNKPRRGAAAKKNEAGTVGPLIRDYQTWFKLGHKMLDENGELARCENENCEDPRRENNPDYKGIIVVKVNGVYMCRFCFLAGWMDKTATEDGQLEIGATDA